VVNDITFRIAVVLMTYYGFDSQIFDVETAFFHGDLDEVIYMDCPKGIEHEESKMSDHPREVTQWIGSSQ
jgi:hypothetical protein